MKYTMNIPTTNTFKIINPGMHHMIGAIAVSNVSAVYSREYRDVMCLELR